MSKHSRNQNTSSVLTYHEKKKLKYGTIKQRLGKDSLRDFDACALCLKQADEPLSCQHGHLYCKACIYESLLTQKQAIAAQTKKWEEQQQRKQEAAGAADEEKKIADIIKFQQAESSILPVSSSSSSSSSAAASSSSSSYKALPAGGFTVLATEETDKSAVERNKLKEKDKQLPCFWIPSLTPESGPKDVEKPVDVTMCPEGKHPVRLKQLKPVQWMHAPEGKDPKAPRMRFMCPTCHTGLTNSIKTAHMRRCGHVLCHTCADLARKEGRCAYCSEQSKADDMVNLYSGTGFSGHGAPLIASVVTPALG